MRLGPRALGTVLACAAVVASQDARALDPARGLAQYVSRVWTTDDGLPQSSVYAVAQTRDGYLWLGTADGLARFDGARFTVFDGSTTPELAADAWIQALLVDADGTLVVGTHQGSVLTYGDGRFHSALPSGVTVGGVRSLAVGPPGTIWVGSSKGLFRVVAGAVSEVTAARVLEGVNAVLVDPDGTVWVGSRKGIATVSGDDLVPSDLAGEIPSIRALLRDGEGALWMSGPGVVRRVLGPERRDFVLGGDATVRSFAPDRDGGVWMATGFEGLARVRDGVLSRFRATDGVASTRLNVVFEDHEGSLWVGTDEDGVQQIGDGKIVPFGTPEGLHDDVVWTVLPDGSGGIVAGTDQGSVTRISAEGAVRTLTAKDGLPTDPVNGLSLDTGGALWVATGSGTFVERGGAFAKPAHGSGLPEDDATAVFTDSHGVTWVGATGALFRSEGEGFVPVALPDRIGRNRVQGLAEDHEGAMWLGTDGAGLFRVKDGDVAVYTKAEGLTDNGVAGLTLDADGSLWIATYGGLTRLRAGKLVRMTRSNGLVDDFVYAALVDADERVWLSSNKGLMAFAKRDFDVLERDPTARIPIVRYGKEDGMRSPECSAGAPGGARSADGRLWFPTVKGVVAVDPTRLRKGDPPPVGIEDVVADRVSRGGPSTTSVALAAGTRDVEIHYTAPSFAALSRVAFRYRLDGFDNDWNDAGPRRVAFYTNLPHGTYTFRVIACNGDGVWNETGARVALSVAPFFWQTVPFLGGTAAAGLASILLAARWRTRNLRRRADELQTKVNERTLELGQRVEQLARANEELLASHQRADRIFSALAEALPGKVLDGKYKLEAPIGVGGFGVVFSATHLNLRQSVAVKVFRPSQGNDSADALERFRREAMTASRVKHPNAITVHDSGISDEGIAYLVMELLVGESLAARLRRNGRMSLRATAAIVRGVSGALEAAHAIGVIHRDMKPENVFMHQEGGAETVKVVDFGIARWLDAETTQPLPLTRNDEVVGTPAFIAPERFFGRPYDGRADVYSVGVMLYEMLSGHLPVEVDGGVRLGVAHLATSAPRPLREHASRLPAGVEAIVMRALASEPKLRPTPQELADAFDRALEGLSDAQLDAIHGDDTSIARLAHAKTVVSASERPPPA
jgi:ligand-binding sensor domain-containing protein